MIKEEIANRDLSCSNTCTNSVFRIQCLYHGRRCNYIPVAAHCLCRNTMMIMNIDHISIVKPVTNANSHSIT